MYINMYINVKYIKLLLMLVFNLNILFLKLKILQRFYSFLFQLRSFHSMQLTSVKQQ